MRDLLKIGATWLAAWMKDCASETVQYARGKVSVQVQATISRSQFNVDDGNGGLLLLESRDYLVVFGDLTTGGVNIKPQEGDQITEMGPDGNPVVYEVARFGNEPCWRFDPYRTRMIVHAKRMSAP
jgi:hypothetical protein